jgi:hypothetical protein
MPASTKDTTAITGLLKGNGTAVSAAIPATDYGPATTALATGLLKNTTGTGTHSIAAVNTDYSLINGTGLVRAAGTVLSYDSTVYAPLASPAFTTPNIGVASGTSFNSITGMSSTATDIKMDGTQSAGSLATVAKADHIHPSDTSKQATLVSGTNIKTVNGNSLLGSGDVVISGGGTPATTVTTEGIGPAAVSAVVGVSTNYAREDHVHATNAVQPVYSATLSNGTVALNFSVNNTVTVTPTITGTFTTTIPANGVKCNLIIITSGTTSYTMTFGTGFKTVGTLSTGTVTGKYFVFSFISNGSLLIEAGRTTAM